MSSNAFIDGIGVDNLTGVDSGSLETSTIDMLGARASCWPRPSAPGRFVPAKRMSVVAPRSTREELRYSLPCVV